MKNLGFSTGCFVQAGLTQRESLKLLSSSGFKTVELSFLRVNELLDMPLPTRKDLEPFDYVSIHAPKHDYGQNETTKRVLAAMSRFWQTIKLPGLVVFHPDTVLDFSVFENRDFPVAFENMDSRSKIGQIPSEMLSLMNRDESYMMVLDVNHVFTINRTGALAASFWVNLSPWISQIHLSGYAPPDHLHWPLFKTRQTRIIRSIYSRTLPIIIESVLATDELIQERDYILKILAN